MRNISLLIFIAAFCSLEGSPISTGRQLLDEGWLFIEGGCDSIRNPKASTAGMSHVDLPHDWSVLHDFDSRQSSGNDGGYLPTGKGWYRKSIDVNASDVGHPTHLYLEGAYMNSEVFVNGNPAGGHPYGYTSYRVDLTPWLKEGENVIAVKVDNSKQKNSRWYTGSGIYRHVWLERHGDIYVKPWSLQVTTPEATRTKGVARINFTLTDSKASEYQEPLKVPLSVSIKGNGFHKEIADTVTFRPGDTQRYCSYEIAVDNPSLWSPASPSLYEAEVALALPDGTEETETERFGFRRIEYSAEKGFILNGIPMKISGACVHHDNGILGAASHDDAEIRKVRLLKEAGFNAVRTSHNPPAPAFLDACDSIGLLVIDEAFDGWKAEKNKHDYNELIDRWWDSDISSLVERDRNHPSVIAWSIGNEIIERKEPYAVELARKFGNLCRSLDPTRPVTQALAAWDPAWEIYDPLAEAHEIIGYNYMIHKAEGDHLRVPSRIIWQTESYPRDAFSNWEKVNDLPYVIGDFVWTGIDYIGESGIGRYWYEGDPEGEHYHRPLWPWHNSYCGDIGITGIRKPVSYYRQLLYSDTPMMHLSVKEPQGYKGKIKEGLWAVYPEEESWNWSGWEGKEIEVVVASSYPEVELFLNGNSIGRCRTDRSTGFKAIYSIPYEKGELKAVAYGEKGAPAETKLLKTSGKPYAVRLKADRGNVSADNSGLIYVEAEIVDRDGNVVSDAAVPVRFEVKGEGWVVATGSDNPKDPKGYHHPDRVTDKGRALAIVGHGNGKKGKAVTVSASSKGLKKGSVSIEILNHPKR